MEGGQVLNNSLAQRKSNNNKKSPKENKIVPLLHSVLCPHSVTTLSPFTRNKKMPKPYTKQIIGILK